MNHSYTNDTKAINSQECIITQIEHKNQIVSKYEYYKLIKNSNTKFKGDDT